MCARHEVVGGRMGRGGLVLVVRLPGCVRSVMRESEEERWSCVGARGTRGLDCGGGRRDVRRCFRISREAGSGASGRVPGELRLCLRTSNLGATTRMGMPRLALTLAIADRCTR
jgi:hypothetical protein